MTTGERSTKRTSFRWALACTSLLQIRGYLTVRCHPSCPVLRVAPHLALATMRVRVLCDENGHRMRLVLLVMSSSCVHV